MIQKTVPVYLAFSFDWSEECMLLLEKGSVLAPLLSGLSPSLDKCLASREPKYYVYKRDWQQTKQKSCVLYVHKLVAVMWLEPIKAEEVNQKVITNVL